MDSSQTLQQQLLQLDGQGYGAYKSLGRCYQFESFQLRCDRIQSDPFARPSQFRLFIPHQLPPDLYASEIREIALRDYLHRQFYAVLRDPMAIAQPSQVVLARSAVLLTPQQVEVRLVVGLPAVGRRIAGRRAADLLCQELPRQVAAGMRLDMAAVRHHVEAVEDAAALRSQLASRNLVAFVGNGALLARRSGIDQRPLEGAIAFQSPQSLEVELSRPNQGAMRGMGIPKGVTLIVGGGFQGKSTLLRAVELGVYNHIPGDGRDSVVTDATAMKVRAEDGRSVANVDISPFINDLPQFHSTQGHSTQGNPTHCFSTPNASGSTSMAAAVVEAMEAGSHLLLIDEDTAATNFMLRDRRMQALIPKSQEPITPLVDQVRSLFTQQQVSTILVMGGSGDYLDVADTVIAMQEYQPDEVTAQARAIAAQYPTQRQPEGRGFLSNPQPRHLPSRLGGEFKPGGGSKTGGGFRADRPKIKTHELDTLTLNHTAIDLSAVEQLVEPGQLRAIAAILVQVQGATTMAEALAIAEQQLAVGFDGLDPIPSGEWVQFRLQELAATLNRWR